MNALGINPSDLVLGIVTRLRVLAPVGLVLWLLGVEIGPVVRLLLVPAVLVILAVDTLAHTAPAAQAPAGGTFRVRPGAGAS
ncbi:hypothetical protein OG618_37720 (plasmid) [Kitasatospora sp. NBC_01246]|uniref:hypothetical protein n=1 Tax=Kitasatospora sp. NBC_01246 TaxID=2903570 RepID=UPI002E329ADA|nr:hypothetical protein [Kitasatospora sp. NBC_01246]